MKFGLNYSPQAAELLKAGKIEIDYFKCPNWPFLIAEAGQFAPAAVHFDLVAGNGDIEKRTDWAEIEHLLSQTATPFVNVHLNPGFPNPAEQSGAAPAEIEEDEILDAITSDLNLLIRRFGAERVIAENVPYREQYGSAVRAAVKPDLIRQVIENTGVGLLLDLSHAAISAWSLGMSEKEYFAGLPLEHICEMHFTGIHEIEGQPVDHLPALPADWDRLDWALEQIDLGLWGDPWMLAFEYGGIGKNFDWRSETEIIANQVPAIYEKVSRIVPGSKTSAH